MASTPEAHPDPQITSSKCRIFLGVGVSSKQVNSARRDWTPEGRSKRQAREAGVSSCPTKSVAPSLLDTTHHKLPLQELS